MTPQLPRAARLYIVAVVAVGLALMVARLPGALHFEQPASFVALLVLSSMTAALKAHLPLTTSGSTMAIAYGVDLASLLLLGPHQTMLVAAGSAFMQGHLSGTDRNPLDRTLCALASLVIAVQASALAFRLLGGSAAGTIGTIAPALAGAGAVFFVVHTLLIAAGLALTAGAPVVVAWREHVLGSVASFLIGLACAALAVSFVTYVGYGIAHYADFYDFRHVLILGRVTSGPGGEVINARAQEVLKLEFPELARKIGFHTPDEKDKRHGQAVAAASLPDVGSRA